MPADAKSPRRLLNLLAPPLSDIVFEKLNLQSVGFGTGNIKFTRLNRRNLLDKVLLEIARGADHLNSAYSRDARKDRCAG